MLGIAIHPKDLSADGAASLRLQTPISTTTTAEFDQFSTHIHTSGFGAAVLSGSGFGLGYTTFQTQLQQQETTKIPFTTSAILDYQTIDLLYRFGEGVLVTVGASVLADGLARLDTHNKDLAFTTILISKKASGTGWILGVGYDFQWIELYSVYRQHSLEYQFNTSKSNAAVDPSLEQNFHQVQGMTTSLSIGLSIPFDDFQGGHSGNVSPSSRRAATPSGSLPSSAPTTSGECYKNSDCSIGQKCEANACVQRTNSESKGHCLSSASGGKTCTNTGISCSSEADCVWKGSDRSGL